jgi:energy-converting hydrogenase A subunit D
MLEWITLTTVSAAVLIIGTIGIIALPKPVDKVIMLSLLQGGFIGMIVSAKYLDVAMAAAIFDPIATVIFLIGITKIQDIRNQRQEEEEGNLA